MKKLSLIINLLLLILLFIVILINSCNSKSNTAELKIRNYYTKYTNELYDKINQLKAVKNGDVQQVKRCFNATRLAYKRIEPLVEYYFQGLSKRINGPALPDLKLDDNQILPPVGLQQIEALIYSDSIDYESVDKVCNLLVADLKYCEKNIKALPINKENTIELIQHNLIRIAAMGITGFDTPISNTGLEESMIALVSTQEISGLLNSNAPTLFNKSIAYLENNKFWETFDRLFFTKNMLMPLGESLNTILPLQKKEQQQAFYGTVSNLFKGENINPNYFVNYAAGKLTKEKAAFGKLLFYDVKLSASQKMSCATCHKPELYFTDGLKTAKANIHGGNLTRNTPTILYASLQNGQFYDMRSMYLEDQIYQVMHNASEFNMSEKSIMKYVASNKNYLSYIRLAYNTDTVSDYTIRNAIASYLRTLTPFSSNFDEYMNGNENAMTAQQKAGYNLFAGKAKCASCHFVPLTNGTIPPFFSKTESEVIGVPASVKWNNALIDSDIGRYRQNNLEPLRFSFKTPTVRNAEKTAPYMHNGVYNNLEDVVQFYNVGGGVGIGIDLSHQTLPFDKLNLSKEERDAIVAFLKSLTDKPAF